MTTAHSFAMDTILDALRSGSVASAAGVAIPLWTDSATPRVVESDGQGYVAGMHRGRLPMIEVFRANPDNWNRLTSEGGEVSRALGIRVHVPGPSQAAAERLGQEIMSAALSEIRSTEYFRDGSDSVDPMVRGVLGFAITGTVNATHAYDRGTYEAI